MGHSKNHGRRGLTLTLQPRAKLIGLSILIAGLAPLITSAQLDPIMVQVERVIDGDTLRVRHQGKNYTVRLIGVDTPETKHPTRLIGGRQGLPRPRSKVRRCYSTAPEIPPLRALALRHGTTSTRLIREYAHAFPSRSGRSLFNWKKKPGDGGSAYGTAAEIAVSLDHPRRAANAAIRAGHFRTVTPCFIDRTLPGEAQR